MPLLHITDQPMSIRVLLVKIEWPQSTTVLPVLSGHSKRPKLVYQDQLSLNAGQKYCRMLQKSILQYFRSSLTCH